VKITKKEATARVIEEFAQAVEDLTGVKINEKKARVLLEKTITVPVSVLLDLGERADWAVNLPYGKISLVERAVCAGIGQDRKRTGETRKWIKLKLNEGLQLEAALLTGYGFGGREVEREKAEKRLQRKAEIYDSLVDRKPKVDEHVDNLKIPFPEAEPIYRMFRGIPVNVNVGSEKDECHCIGKSICRSPIRDMKF